MENGLLLRGRLRLEQCDKINLGLVNLGLVNLGRIRRLKT